MPLLDHFHPPLSLVHGWRGFHTAWIAYTSGRLNRVLPLGYFAEETAHAGPHFEIDIATFGADAPPVGGPAVPAVGRVAVAEPAVWAPPVPTTVPVVFADDFEVRVLSNLGGEARRLVAAIELVSPANKDRPSARRAFAAKVASYLYNGVAVILVDVVTDRTANLHNEALDLFAPPGVARLPDSVRLYAAAYQPIRRGDRTETDIWVVPLAVGDRLPTLPLWLTAVEYVPVDFEETYVYTCGERRIAV